MGNDIVLFENPADCCGCGACANACPKQAIELQKDAYGFLYPAIRADRCVSCGLCKEVCAFQKKEELPLPRHAYAVQSQREEVLKKSASGGVFAMIALHILEQGGVVAGCALEWTADGVTPRHILIDSPGDLVALQGSKYVQSAVGDVYQRVKNALDSGKQVLFSGTPCQVDGLNAFLRGKAYANLLTMDLICHGTPNADLFAEYIKTLEKKVSGTIVDFKFRDKSASWGLNGSYIYNGSYTYKDRQGNVKTESISARRSSYYKLFLDAEIHRDSCYHCKYACMHRCSDLTIGDFWGIEKQHPAYLQENGGDLRLEAGISCVLANTEKGRAALDSVADGMHVRLSQCAAVAEENRQVNLPSVAGKHREKVLKLYRKAGYGRVEKWYSRRQFLHRCLRKLRRKRNRRG
ncbi:MAG: Coenzyme F420 hydrogenase/dehydrogenase, beta subunit C-terminal domain [Oscillospiraceae bacterium]|nr:Coenzyme F420 hydrogenase/dehydrogenase, beta subunit C-terminal domain [Oscillospiraceae bacterium]